MPVVIGARAHDFPCNDPETLFPAIAAAGYESIQLACPKSFNWKYPLNKEQIERIILCREKYHISVAVLGCYVDPAVNDTDKRMNAVQTYINGLKTAKDIGASCVGTETSHFFGNEKDRIAAFERLTDSVLRMADVAEKIGVNIGIEPVFGHTLATPELACELKNRVGSKRLKWIWDAVNLLDPADKAPVCILQKHTAELLGSDIVAMHIKDVIYKEDNIKRECPLFEGDYDWSFPFHWAAEQDNMILLREQAIPQRSAEEIEKMKNLLKSIGGKS